MLAPEERGMIAISVAVEDILGVFSIVCDKMQSSICLSTLIFFP